MKKKLLFGIGIIVVLLVGLIIYNRSQSQLNSFGASHLAPSNAATLFGSSTNLVSVPREVSFANSTTTDSTNSFSAGVQQGYLDGGGTIIQAIPTGGEDFVWLTVSAVGGTATSTMFIRQQFSYDNSNWFDFHASSTPSFPQNYNTSTAVTLTPAGINFVPGTATSTAMGFLFNTYGMKFSRFLFSASDVRSDPNDGVQAWVQALNIEPLSR